MKQKKISKYICFKEDQTYQNDILKRIIIIQSSDGFHQTNEYDDQTTKYVQYVFVNVNACQYIFFFNQCVSMSLSQAQTRKNMLILG